MNSRQALALLWITILNQSQSSSIVIKNMPILFDRLKIDEEFKVIPYEQICYAMTTPTSLHRFPRKMSKYLAESLITINDRFKMCPVDVFSVRQEILSNLLLFSGIGEHKANIAIYIYDCILGHEIYGTKHLRCNISEEDVIAEISYINSLGKSASNSNICCRSKGIF